MQSFFVIDLTKWKRWAFIACFVILATTFLWMERESALSMFQEDKPVALTRGDKDNEAIALTFNISWGNEKVHDILEQLKKHEVHATFFVSGEWAERHPDILEKITEGKHELGMLGYRYKSYVDQELEQVQKDLQYAKEVFNKLGYEDMRLLRTPSGHFNKEIIKLAESLNFQIIHWNINPNDWKNPGVNVIAQDTIEKTSNGDILLLHASDAAKQTAEALDIMLPALKKKDFQFISISEMIHQTESNLKSVD